MSAESVVGRERELEAISSFFELDPVGGRMLLLEGEAGIGKTTLWREAVTAAADDDARVLLSRPAAAEAALVFSGLGDLLGDVLSDVAGALPDPQVVALEVALLRRGAGDRPADPRTVAAGVLGALRTLARGSPVVVAVDDVQWLDPGSAAALGYALRRLTAEPVWVVAALRLETGSSSSPLIEAQPRDRLVRLPVGPLSSGAVHRMLRLHLGRTLPRPVLRRVHDLSGGNPFYALELTRSLPEDPRAGVALPPSLAGLTRERLGRLPPAVRRQLEPAALLADPTVELLEALSSQPRRVGERLDSAVAAGVVAIAGGSVRFTHPLLAEATADTIGPRRRAGLHAQLAALVDEPEQRAHHLALAATRPDAETAAAIEDGARAALARGATAAAAELLEAAAALTPDDNRDERWRRSIDAAGVARDAGLWARARSLLEESLAELPSGGLRADALLVLGDLTTGGLKDADRVLVEALANAEGDDARVSVIQFERASLVFVRTGSVAAWREQVELALAAATRTGDPALLVPVLAQASFAELCAGRFARDRLDQALEMQRRTSLALRHYESPSFVLGMHYLYVDRLDEGRELLEAAADNAVRTGDEPSCSAVLLHLVELECRAANFEVARAHADECRLLAEQQGNEHARSAGLYGQALVDAHLGRVSEAREAAERGVAISEEIGDHVFRVQNLAVLGFLELSVGNVLRAAELLRPLPRWLVEHGWDDPSVCPAWPNSIEALVGVGELEQAAAYLELYEERARRCDCPWALATAARCLGLLRLAQGDVDGALAAHEQALREHRRTPGAFERGRTLLHSGVALRLARRKREARERLQTSLAIFEELDAGVFAERAREELARIGGRPPAGDELTTSERRIAELVAEGKSNKEVAAQLFIAPRTVEGHLTRIYEKLGVRSRAELAHRLPTPAR